MSDLVGKKHVEQTEKHWVEASSPSPGDPDPEGALVALICDILQAFSAGECELDATRRQQVERRSKALRINPLHVWNAVVALAHTLPRKIG